MVVIDTDGSAFITKAEFDSLKNNFQAQIDNYNNSIDSKIDGAIAAYLAGVNVAQEFQLYYNPTANYTFVNSMRGSEQKADQGVTNLQHNRLAGFYGCTGLNATMETWKKPKKGFIRIKYKYAYDSMSEGGKWTDVVDSIEWADSEAGWGGGEQVVSLYFDHPDTTYVHPYFEGNLKDAYTNIIKNANMQDIWQRVYNWNILFSYLTAQNCYNTRGPCPLTCYNYESITVSNFLGCGTPKLTGGSATLSRVNSEHVFSVYDELNSGVGWGIDMINLIPCLKKWYKKISIQNTIEIQNFTYKDGSGSTSSNIAWDDTSNVGYSLEPDLNFQQQLSVNPRINSDTTETSSPKTYHRFLASQIKDADNTAWSSEHQLGTASFESTMRCFDESCTLNHGGLQTIDGSTLKFDRTGYYISGGALQTKYNNYVSTGNIEWKNLIWDSTIYNTKDVKLDSFSSLAGENVYLGGGIPLAYTPAERTGVKVKVNYEVKKLDGSAITAADGSMNIKIELSNKQFSNGGINTAAGAVSKDSFNTTVSNVSATGSWTSNAFNMGDKSKLWLNAYVADKQGYNIIIKNIDIQ